MSLIKSSELNSRVISAIVLTVSALASIWFGGIFFQAFWGLTAFICFFEWISISMPGLRPIQYIIAGFVIFIVSRQNMVFSGSIIVSLAISGIFIWFFSIENRRVWAVSGLVYAALFAFSMTALRASPNAGLIAVIWLCSIVWLSDVAAFFCGRTFGGPKLMPKISPKKTWSGFLCGIAGGILANFIVLYFAEIPAGWQHLVIAACLSIAAAIGDLLESAFKRHFGVKDSGSLIPGHGGVFDRADGLIAASIIAAIIGFACNPDPATGLLQW